MERQNPCFFDADRFCRDVKPGEGRIIACLKPHAAELSDVCRTRGLEEYEKTKALEQACGADLGRFCAQVKGGSAAKLRCLLNNLKELAGACKAALPAAKTSPESK